MPDIPPEIPNYYGPPYRQEYWLEYRYLQYDWYDFYKSNFQLEPKRGKLADVVEGFVLEEEPEEIEVQIILFDAEGKIVNGFYFVWRKIVL